jgi:2-aminoadipate transaminase
MPAPTTIERHPEMATDSSFDITLPQPQLSQRREWAARQVIGFLMQQAVENPDCISLAAGLVDQETLPVELTQTVMRELLDDEDAGRQMLQYGTTQGADSLRQSFLNNFARLEEKPAEELGIGVEHMVLTTGSQQLLSLIGEVLLDPGDICLVAAPTYFVFLSVLKGLGARAIPVATDDDGMRMDALEGELERLESAGELDRVKLIYLVSDYENPSGVSLSAERREVVVEIARRWSKSHRLFVLEDAAYRELRYDGPDFPSIWNFDAERETVIVAQTFSKSFSPGLRVGYGVLPGSLVEAVCDRKSNEDFGSANFNQQLLATMIDRGLYAQHVEKLQSSYRVKRDAMVTAAETHFADIPGAKWVAPHGGLYLWLTLPTEIDTGFDSPLFERAAKVHGVMYVPGEICYVGDEASRPRNKMRLSFGVQTPAGIDEGMQRLANAVKVIL